MAIGKGMAGSRTSDPTNIGRSALSLRRARKSDSTILTDLAIRSKAHWGYDAEFMAACHDELEMPPRRLSSERVTVAELDGVVVGFAALDWSAGDMAEVTALFVSPSIIGQGVGARLLTALKAQARERAAVGLWLDADPNAQAFYARQGFRLIGDAPSLSTAGRRLPRMVWRTKPKSGRSRRM